MPEIKKFTGINNKAKPHDARLGDLQTAANVLITDDGAIKRRPGLVEISNDPTHSLFSVGDALYYVQDNTLVKNDLGPVALVDPLVDGSSQMSYLYLNGLLYFSNGTDQGIVNGEAATAWGVTPPTQPVITDTAGGGDPGDYLVSLTYLLADGQESAASQTLSVSSVGGIVLVDIPVSTDSRVTHVCVYVSGPNGEATETGGGLFRVATIANGTTSLTFSPPGYGPECQTLNLVPMPAGKFIGFYRGRMYVAVGQFLYYSMPWNYGLTSLQHGFLPFESEITSVCYLENGIWVGTLTGSMFVAGQDPQIDGGMQIKNRLAGVCTTGSVTLDWGSLGIRTLAQGLLGVFVTENGVVVGDGVGQVEQLTKDYWLPTNTTARPIGSVITLDNSSWYVFLDGDAHYAMNLGNRAVTKMISDCNSFTEIDGVVYACGPAGLWSLDGTDDVGTAIAATFSKTGMDFGSNKKKRIVDLFFHTQSTANMTVVVTGETGQGTVTLSDTVTSPHGSHVRLPRGVSGRNLALEFSNVAGADFEVASMEMVVEEVRDRHARQTMVSV